MKTKTQQQEIKESVASAKAANLAQPVATASISLILPPLDLNASLEGLDQQINEREIEEKRIREKLYEAQDADDSALERKLSRIRDGLRDDLMALFKAKAEQASRAATADSKARQTSKPYFASYETGEKKLQINLPSKIVFASNPAGEFILPEVFVQGNFSANHTGWVFTEEQREVFKKFVCCMLGIEDYYQEDLQQIASNANNVWNAAQHKATKAEREKAKAAAQNTSLTSNLVPRKKTEHGPVTVSHLQREQVTLS